LSEEPRVKPRYNTARQLTPVGTESRAKQSFKDQCDINIIVRAHASGHEVTHLNPNTPQYGDFSAATDLQDQLNGVMAAQAEFDALPSAVRAAAENNPVRFLEMCADIDGRNILVEAGLPGTSKIVPTPEPEQPEAAPTPAPEE